MFLPFFSLSLSLSLFLSSLRSLAVSFVFAARFAKFSPAGRHRVWLVPLATARERRRWYNRVRIGETARSYWFLISPRFCARFTRVPIARDRESVTNESGCLPWRRVKISNEKQETERERKVHLRTFGNLIVQKRSTKNLSNYILNENCLNLVKQSRTNDPVSPRLASFFVFKGAKLLLWETLSSLFLPRKMFSHFAPTGNKRKALSSSKIVKTETSLGKHWKIFSSCK